MDPISQILKKNLESKELDYNFETCPKCKEALQMKINLFGKDKIIPRQCKCIRDKREKEEREQENLQKQYRLKKIINNSLMDSKFRTCTFENWNHNLGSEKIFEIGKKYSMGFKEMKKQGVGLLIYGNPGNGKTYVSSCIANTLMNNLTPVIIVSINALLDRIKQTFSSWGKEGEETILRSLSNADLLVIDDLGTEQDTDWSRTKIYNIIDSRYRNGLPLIVTTNISLEDLKEKYHVRTYDRLIEMCTPVRNEGKSIRTEKAREKTKILSELLK